MAGKQEGIKLMNHLAYSPSFLTFQLLQSSYYCIFGLLASNPYLEQWYTKSKY